MAPKPCTGSALDTKSWPGKVARGAACGAGGSLTAGSPLPCAALRPSRGAGAQHVRARSMCGRAALQMAPRRPCTGGRCAVAWGAPPGAHHVRVRGGRADVDGVKGPRLGQQRGVQRVAVRDAHRAAAQQVRRGRLYRLPRPPGQLRAQHGLLCFSRLPRIVRGWGRQALLPQEQQKRARYVEAAVFTAMLCMHAPRARETLIRPHAGYGGRTICFSEVRAREVHARTRVLSKQTPAYSGYEHRR